MTTATNYNGEEIDLDTAASLMDADIREDVSSNFAPGFDNPTAFLAEYARRHAEAFDGEEFAPYYDGNW